MRGRWAMMLWMGLAGCGDSGSGGSGGAGASGATTSGTTTGLPPGAECLDKATQADCEAAGCHFATGRLFDPVNDCLDMTPIGACMQKLHGAVFGGSALYQRDEGLTRIVVEYQYNGTIPYGWQECGWCPLGVPCDWCQCAE